MRTLLVRGPLPDHFRIGAATVFDSVRRADEILSLSSLSEGGVLLAVGSAADAPPDELEPIRQAVLDGLRLVIAPDRAGTFPQGLLRLAAARAIEDHGDAEWILCPAAAEEGSRLDPSIAFRGRFREICFDAPDVVAIATVNVGLRERLAMARRTVGLGDVVVTGIAPDDGRSVDVDRLVGRCLRRELTSRPGAELGVGVVGYGPLGGTGHRHGLALEATPGLRLAAAADRDPARLVAASDTFPGIQTTTSVDELLHLEDLDVVIVATPPSAHADIARRVIESGRSIVVEKPLCFGIAEADALIAQAEDAGVSLTVHQNRRWDRDFSALRHVIERGEIGEVFNVETFVGSFEHPCRHWHSDQTISGGAVYDWGSHHVDWILQLMSGSPDRVRANGHKRVWRDVTNLDQVRVHLDFADGREAEFFQSDLAAIRRPKFWIQGTLGTVAGSYQQRSFERIEEPIGFVSETAHHAEAPVELTMATYETGWGVSERTLSLGPEQRFGFHRNLADHLLFGEPLAVSAASVRQVIAVLEAAQGSLELGGAEMAVATPN